MNFWVNTDQNRHDTDKCEQVFFKLKKLYRQQKTGKFTIPQYANDGIFGIAVCSLFLNKHNIKKLKNCVVNVPCRQFQTTDIW